MTLKLKITGKQGIIFEGDVDFCEIPTSAGIEGILPSHVNFISGFAGGSVRYAASGKTGETAPAAPGFVEVSGDLVNILIDS